MGCRGHFRGAGAAMRWRTFSQPSSIPKYFGGAAAGRGGREIYATCWMKQEPGLRNSVLSSCGERGFTYHRNAVSNAVVCLFRYCRLSLCMSVTQFSLLTPVNHTNSVALSSQANYTDWAIATCRRNLVPTFVDRGVSRCQRGGSPTVVNLSFLDRSRYFSFM
jgi:hypothetical protein